MRMPWHPMLENTGSQIWLKIWSDHRLISSFKGFSVNYLKSKSLLHHAEVVSVFWQDSAQLRAPTPLWEGKQLKSDWFHTEDTHHKIQFMLSCTVVDHYKSNTLCYKANRSELRELLSFITCLATLPTWPLGNYNRIRWVFSTNYDWRLDRMLRHPCKPKLIQFDPIAVRLCRLSGVVGSRTRGFVNSRQPSTVCIIESGTEGRCFPGWKEL
jgi:hypothetical protein